MKFKLEINDPSSEEYSFAKEYDYRMDALNQIEDLYGAPLVEDNFDRLLKFEKVVIEPLPDYFLTVQIQDRR